jgi:uncharacterized membrane protein YhhN
MPVVFYICCAVTAAAVCALLLAEYRNSRIGVWIAKPVASAGFVAAGMLGEAAQTSYGRWVLIGLVLSMLGDVLLIPRGRESIFRLGVFSFLLGHVSYSVAFAGLSPDSAATAVAAVVFVGAGLLIARRLAGHIPAGLAAAAYAYMLVITVMVVLAGGAAVATAHSAIFVGALAFYLSDISVALDRLVEENFMHRLWGLPLYFAAQLVLAATTLR